LEQEGCLDIEQSLQNTGYAVLRSLLLKNECEQFSAMYKCEDFFRSRINMTRHGFGRGEYKYFAYPLPGKLQALRRELYPRLAVIANQWNDLLGKSVRYPEDLTTFLSRCHAVGQVRPTPLLLQYTAGDYNCLHQDLYGDLVFPLQIAILLSAPGEDFTGGEFIMTQNINGCSPQAEVIPLRQGDAVIFTVHSRPVPGKNGRSRRATMRHGVSQIRSGRRHTLGLIFHDSQ
jgi:hypothetical protein